MTGKWADEETLFAWAREVSPDSMTPHVEYGRLMAERAQAARDPMDRAYYSDAAFRAYQRSLAVDPDLVLVTAVEREKGNLGQADALFLEGDFESALQVYERIVGHYLGSAIGWANFLYGDNSAAIEAIKADNPDMSDEQIAFSIEKLKEYGIVDSGAALELGIGAITFSPLAQGLLTDKYLAGIPSGSRATQGKTIREGHLSEQNLERIKGLHQIAERTNWSRRH